MDAIVLAGGGATRLGGRDKAGLVLAGRTSFERVLDAVAGAARVVVVGDVRPTERDVVWTREEPPGGGPVAAIAAALPLVAAEHVAVVAVDLPLLRREDLAVLEGLAADRDGALFVDDDGRDQPLAGVYRTERLRRGVERLATTSGASVRSLTADLDLERVRNARASLDCDTQEDLERVEALLRR
jgi:molybdopterin-guanine dinucleotide biosynthesis protein A